jgi:drug/metabolite transporter (DMT)-like permease
MVRLTWFAFGLLCLLSSAAWVIPVTLSLVPVLEDQISVFGVIGLVALLFVRRRPRLRSTALDSAWLIVGSVVLFGVPNVVIDWARGGVPSSGISALFAMVPIVVVLAVAVGGEDGVRRLFPWALVGLGGVLLLLPLDVPGALRGRVMIVSVLAVVVLVGIASVWMHRLLRGFRVVDAVAIVCLSNAVFLVVWCLVSQSFVWGWAAISSNFSVSSVVSLVEVVLVIWLLREMRPVHFAARYLVIPLLTVVEGIVVLRPELTVRMGVGVVLLGVGAGRILLWSSLEGSEEEGLSLR